MRKPACFRYIVQSLYFLNPKFRALAIFCGYTVRFVSETPKTVFFVTRLLCHGPADIKHVKQAQVSFMSKYLLLIWKCWDRLFDFLGGGGGFSVDRFFFLKCQKTQVFFSKT